MTTTMVNIDRYRGRFFEVLQETERTQTAVMTIAPRKLSSRMRQSASEICESPS